MPLLGTLLWLCAVLLLFPGAALGEEFEETFGSANEPTFLEPLGMAVDQSSGDLLVIDGQANTVSRWNSDGTPDEFSALGSNVIDGSETPEGEFSFDAAEEVQIAVDNSGGATDGNIYVPQIGAGVVDIFAEDGSFLGQLTEYNEGPEAEGPASTIGFPCGVAVDPAGNLYVGDFGGGGRVLKYEPAANPPVNGDNSANFTGPVCTLAAGAGPTAGFIFRALFLGSVAKLDSTTGDPQYTVASGPTRTVTVNPASGQVYTAVATEVRRFDASGESEAELISSFTLPSKVTGIAVDEATGNVYVARAANTKIEVFAPGLEAVSKAASAVGGTGATLNGSVNPSGVPVSECFFEWGETSSYGEVAPCEEPDAEEVGEGKTFVPVHTDLSGLETGTEYHFRLVAVNENEVKAEGTDEEFRTVGPAIKEEQASQISATSARLSGLVNPRGEETSYVFEYVTEASFEETGFEEAVSVPSPAGEIGAGNEFKEVSRQITGLSPGTAYRFRILAANLSASGEGEARKFATFSPQPPVLPDGRAYEMVSPPEKIGEPYPPEPTERLGGSCPFYINLGCLPGRARFSELMPMQSAPDGEAVAYAGQPFTLGLASDANEYLGRRAAVGGWETEGLSSPLFRSFERQGFKAFSADLSRAVLYQIEPALSPAAPSRGAESFANLYRWQEGALEPLLTEEPPQRDPGFQSANRFRIFYGGANAGTALVAPFSHIVFAANDALTGKTAFAPAVPAVEATRCEPGENCNLYEWEEGELRLVNVLGDNETAVAGAVIGSRPSVDDPPNVERAISEDGSRIFWSDESGQLFVRIDGEETREIEDPGRFLTATPEGSKVLLGDGCLYSLAAEECEADLTEDEGGVPRGGFAGILGAAEDLSRVYFVDTEVLSGEEENANGEAAEEGGFNLYAWEEGATDFIGTLLNVDNQVHGAPPPAFGDWRDSPAVRTAQVSADGRYLAFMSKAPLSGYDNRLSGGGTCFHPPFGIEAGEACYEVFEYDAVAEALACVSCNPSGQRPLGSSNLSLFRQGEPRPIAPLPPPHNLTLDGQGRIFFESMDPLVQADTNGRVQDVYEWEPQGVGSCERAGGCIALISSGHDSSDSWFLNTTPNGSDAFFLTRERLLGRDKDEQLDLYDARAAHVPGEAVGFPEGVTPPCGGEACKGPISSPPAQPSAGSSAIDGAGNAKPKKPKHKKKHHKKKKKKRRGGSR